MRLQVFLSHNGVCSRRDAMDVIKAGRVCVNGRLQKEPSTPISPGQDQVTVDGDPVGRRDYDYVILNKPAGYVTTKEDRHAEKTVLDLLPASLKHLHPVGRLDKESEGLLLLTNDGQLTHRLTHPRFHLDKTYSVRIRGVLKPGDKDRLEKGIELEGQKTLPAKIRDVKDAAGQTEFLITIQEGRKRQIRLMLAACGHQVVILKRLSQGPIDLGYLKPGAYRRLTEDEVSQLKKTAEV